MKKIAIIILFVFITSLASGADSGNKLLIESLNNSITAYKIQIKKLNTEIYDLKKRIEEKDEKSGVTYEKLNEYLPIQISNVQTTNIDSSYRTRIFGVKATLDNLNKFPVFITVYLQIFDSKHFKLESIYLCNKTINAQASVELNESGSWRGDDNILNKADSFEVSLEI